MKRRLFCAAIAIGAVFAATAQDVEFALSFRTTPNGAPQRVAWTNATGRTCEKENGCLKTIYRFAEGSPAKSVTVRERTLSGGETRRRISVEIEPGWNLEDVDFPIVRLVPDVMASSRDLRLVLGAAKGGIAVDPMKKPVGWRWFVRDPERMVASFAAAYAGKRGFYFAAEDEGFDVKRISFERNAAGVSLAHSIECWTSERFEMGYDVVTRRVESSGDDLVWEDFADIYRKWNDRQPWMRTAFADRKDVPDWMKRGPAMTRFSRQWLESPDDMAAFMKWWRGKFGEGDVVAAIWGWEKVGTWWGPDYFPCHPDDDTFRRETAMMKSMGFHSFVWPSGYNWCKYIGRRPDGTYEIDYRDTFLKNAAAHLAMRRDGKPFHMDAFWLRNGALTSICGGEAWSRKWLDDLARALGERGCEMVQVDQVVGGRLRECWNPAHGHALGRGSWQREAFPKQMETMLRALKEVQPDGMLAVEEPNARLTELVGIQDYRDLESDQDEYAGVYSYLYHGHVPIFQSNPFRDEIHDLAYMAAEGQIPFFKPLFSDMLERRPLLENGGFEDLVDSVRGPSAWERCLPGTSHWTGMDAEKVPWSSTGWCNQGWGGVGVNLDGEEIHGGKWSLRLEPVAGKYWKICPRVLYVAQTITDVPPGEYELSAWVKTAECANGGEGAILHGTRLGGEKGRIAFPAAGTGWRKVLAKIKIDGELRLVVRATPGYRGWIDDIRLCRADGDDAVTRDDSLYVRFMKRWMALYRGDGLDFIANGLRIKPPTLECGRIVSGGRRVPSVRHAAYRSADGREALVLANAAETAQKCACTWKGKRREYALAPGEIRLDVVPATGGASAGPLEKALLHGETNKRAIDYAPGEEMVFTLSLRDAQPFPDGKYFIQWDRTGDDGLKDGGKVPLSMRSKPLVIRTRIDRPGFVRVHAVVVDAKGARVKRPGKWDDVNVFFDGGAAVKPETLRQGVPEPKDFDEFWAKRKARLAKVPLKAWTKDVSTAKAKNARVYQVSVACAGPRPVTGHLTVPRVSGKWPARLTLDGYGTSTVEKAPADGAADEVVLHINAHGYEIGREKEYYAEFYNSIKSGGMNYAMDERQNASPETCYFSGMSYRVMRALEYLKSRTEWNGRDLIVSGGSQGGLQTAWAAALDHDVTRAESSITWCCDLGGETVGRNRGSWYVHWAKGLGYYDPVNMAKRVPKTCTFVVPRAGFGDYVCPPSGLWAMWNALRCPKEITWLQGSTHGYVPREPDHQRFTIKE